MAITQRVRRVTRIVAVTVFLPLAATHAQQLASDDEIRGLLVRRVATGRNPAIVVGIYDNGQTRIIPMGRSGAPNDSLDGNTVFEIGSITKVFTSMLLADMVARHGVAFEDSVGKYLPSTVRVPTKNWDLPTLAGAGALRSSANDMLRFAAAALGAPGTPPAVASALAEAEKPRRQLGPDGKSEIGLNWFTAHGDSVDIVWHNGGTGGYRSFLGLDKAHGRAVVVLTNSAATVDDIGRHLLDPSLPLTGNGR